MSQDPQPEYNPDPERSYTDPSTYDVSSSPSPSVPPYPYPEQPNYYGEQPPSSALPQGTYGIPGYDPNQGGYYNSNQGGYGYQASEPLPLNQAINQLPNQYIRVLTKPSPLTFAAEMGKASWDILWVQLIAYAIIAGILSYLQSLMPSTAMLAGTAANNPYSSVTHVITAYTTVVLVPISFFIGQGIIFLLAKAFGGTGTFLQQAYSFLLIIVPIGIVSGLLGFIPILGGLAAFGLGVYGIILRIFALMPVHRLNGGKATAVILIPVGVLLILATILVVFIVVVLFAALQSAHPYATP